MTIQPQKERYSLNYHQESFKTILQVLRGHAGAFYPQLNGEKKRYFNILNYDEKNYQTFPQVPVVFIKAQDNKITYILVVQLFTCVFLPLYLLDQKQLPVLD